MKVLQVINQLQGGGAEKLAVQLHEIYADKGCDVRTVSLTGCFRGVAENFSDVGASSPWRSGFRLGKYFHNFAKNNFVPDIVHTHLTQSQILAPRFWPKRLGSPVWVTTEHDTWNRRRKSRAGRFFDRRLYQPYSSVIAISEGVRRGLVEWLPEISQRVVTIPNGIELKRWSASTRSFDGVLHMVSAGRLVHKKNMDGLLRALALLEVPWRCTIAGEGPDRKILESLTKELALEGRVNFAGYVGDMNELYASADVVVLFSRYEGFGLAAAEAMATGVPVVASDVPGLREIVGAELPKVAPTDFPGLARILGNLAGDPGERARLGAEGLRRAKHFDLRTMADSYLSLYESLLGKPALE